MVAIPPIFASENRGKDAKKMDFRVQAPHLGGPVTAKPVQRVNTGGNFCGHDPLNPDLDLPVPMPTGKGGIPRVLSLAGERLDQYFWSPRTLLPSLNLANGSHRQQRSERRVACIRVLKILIRYTELASLRVGIPTESGFMGMTLDYLGPRAGLPQRRLERALQDLRAAGLVTTRQPRERRADGSWRGLASVKAISRHVFAVLGLEVALKVARKRAAKALRSRPSRESKGTLADAARLQLAVGGAKRPRAAKPQPPRSEDWQRRYNAHAAELIRRHPDMSFSDVKQKATMLADNTTKYPAREG